MQPNEFIIGPDDVILVTGATGFIGSALVKALLAEGFRNLRCLVRSPTRLGGLESSIEIHRGGSVQLVPGNLLSRGDCARAAQEAKVIFHLAAARGEKSFSEAFRNSVVTTRNLLEVSVRYGHVRRFVNVSSFSVYSNRHEPRQGILDESCPVEAHPELWGDAYSYAKTKQDEIVAEYGKRLGVPYVIVRPGYVIGPGNPGMTGRVGTGMFGLFLHLGGTNPVPFTYVENCAEAILLAGLQRGIESEVFNVVDDHLPSSREFLRLYKRNVRSFKSLYVPHLASYTLCYLWEKYSTWSKGQLPPVFNRRKWHAYWKKTRYSNEKLKTRLGWKPRVPMSEGLRRYFESCRVAM
jgi:nucleoside-diphosphate-sugar epimerase